MCWRREREASVVDWEGRGFEKALEGAGRRSSCCCAMAGEWRSVFPPPSSLLVVLGFGVREKRIYEREGPLSEKGIVPAVCCRLRILFSSGLIQNFSM
jgi:hypothetical protein